MLHLGHARRWLVQVIKSLADFGKGTDAGYDPLGDDGGDCCCQFVFRRSSRWSLSEVPLLLAGGE